MAMVITVLMILEGAGVYFLVKTFSGPPAIAAAGEGSSDSAGGPKTAVDDLGKRKKLEEVKLGDCRPSNRVTGKLITFQMSVSALVMQQDVERVKQMVAQNEARLRDRINFVVRSADPEHINEPSLDTLKRRMKFEFDRVLEDPELVKEVLIPEFLQSGPGL